MPEVRIIENGDDVLVETPPDRWKDRLLRNSSGPQPISYNVKLIVENDFRLAGAVRHCTFSQRVTRHRALPWSSDVDSEWGASDTLALRHWLADNYGFEPGKEAAVDGISGAAYARPYHPVREYLDALEWDGTPRLDMLLYRYFGADDNNDGETAYYLQRIGAWWMQAAVQRVFEPGCKFDYVLILEGEQGIGKSSALRVLGGDWFTDGHLDLGSKDGNQFVQGVWIIELAELDALNKVEATRAKSFFGQQDDRFRPPFGQQVQRFQRQCVFAGSTNLEHYLKDPTGGRRYWPVRCGDIDHKALEADRDQLWAEAVHRSRAGRRFAPGAGEKPVQLTGRDKRPYTTTEQRIFERQQDARFSADSWQSMIEEHLETVTADQITTATLMEDALGFKARDMRPPEQVRVGLIMAKVRTHHCPDHPDGRPWKKRRLRLSNGKGGIKRVWAYCKPGGRHDES